METEMFRSNGVNTHHSTGVAEGKSGAPSTDSADRLEAEIKARGLQIFEKMDHSTGSVFNKDWWYGRIMDWSMKNETFKVQMFRFVDVLPYLNTSSEVAKHLKEYFAEGGDSLPSIFNFGLGMGSLAPGLMAGAVKKNVQQMAKMFITGESPKEALPVLKKSRKNGLCFTVDLLGESTLSEPEAKEYETRYLELIEDLSKDAESWGHNPVLDEDDRGPLPKVNISVKLTALYSQIELAAWDESKAILKERLRTIFQRAVAKNVFVNIDMEQYAYKDLTLEVFKELAEEAEFKSYPHFGIVVQAYLRDSLKDVQSLVNWAKNRGAPVTVRLVKGAYWDYEVIHAQQHDWPIPVFTQKKESDANYELCSEVLLKGFPFIRLALGSHNVRSIAAALVRAEQFGVPQKAVEVQMLYGMAEPIKKSLISQGVRLREYATVGELIPGMAYLVRRLLENTSNESFLRSKFAENESPEKLLANPADGLTPSKDRFEKKPDLFYNCAPLDFGTSADREAMNSAMKKWAVRFPLKYQPYVDGAWVTTGKKLSSFNPSQSSQVVAEIDIADTALSDRALSSARAAWNSWRFVPASDRAQYLIKLADLIEKDRVELAALEVYEAGKTWSEADGDITEAIDFCRYYAKEMLRLSKPTRTGHAPGELSLYHYQGRGVALIIAPWNFPLAILAGMAASALVTGNTVLIKPAEQSSAIAGELMKRLEKLGLPKGVVQFLPGYGEEIGAHLVKHKDIDLISFTGSRDVGVQIYAQASLYQPRQRSLKKCLIEMGGKNAIIVDSDADLDEAVEGILYSAFGFQGQKCSACSRLIVLEGIYDRLLDRLVKAAESIQQGPATDPKSYLGPVIDQEAFDRITATIEKAKLKHRLAYQGPVVSGGYYVPPTIFSEVDGASELAQEEIFGPVLAVIKVKDLDEALRAANSTDYALTGGVFSRSPANIERVKREFEVGNLYINRGNTGAMVERHPFGGFKMSGVGSKTGGPDYLIQFMEPRVITENTLRRGFAPQAEGDA